MTEVLKLFLGWKQFFVDKFRNEPECKPVQARTRPFFLAIICVVSLLSAHNLAFVFALAEKSGKKSEAYRAAEQRSAARVRRSMRYSLGPTG